MPSRQIRAVFFDAAGTLFTVNGSVGEIYARLAREHSKEVAVADLEAGFRRCFAATPAMAFPGASPEQILVLEKQWWRDLVQNVFAPLGPFPEFAAYFDALFACFARPDAWRLYPETLEILTALQDRGLLLGIISNFDSRLFGLLEGLGLARFFDPVVISTQAGAAKPETAIFTRALAHHGLRPDDALHIGDSYDADIVGAQSAGLTPVLVDRRGHDQGTDSYLRVRTLAELLAIIDR
ncbi:MAG: HAD-IA family hydrolase [Deltaproteobacteria bacterium]|nr:HAD-IA family hydrolase [Deltaproteobacteria bacterium]